MECTGRGVSTPTLNPPVIRGISERGCFVQKCELQKNSGKNFQIMGKSRFGKGIQFGIQIRDTKK